MQQVIKSDCKYLKSKKSFMHSGMDPERWRTNRSRTCQYWCTKTMGVNGPDDGQVNPEECQGHRNCFVTTNF